MITPGATLPPPTPGNPDNAFVMQDGVRIYGGFPAANPNPSMSDRDWQSYQTILNGYLSTGITAYHVVISANTTQYPLLDGFFIKSGYANGLGSSNVNGTPVSRDCGGGVCVVNGEMALTEVEVSTNTAMLNGGGVYAFNSNFEMKASNVLFNFADVGAGIYCENCNYIYMEYDTIYTNFASTDGAGSAIVACTNVNTGFLDIYDNIANHNGGGMYNLNSTLTIYNTKLYKNNAGQNGGGIYNE
jgi:hypothetical protein